MEVRGGYWDFRWTGIPRNREQSFNTTGAGGMDVVDFLPTYEWLDTPEKLNYLALPDYPAWYSKLKGCFVLKLSEFKECKKIFKEKGMKTFADWLRYYNNLDVAPGLEALEKMRAFYTEKGIGILKDAVSLPGVSLHYLLRGTIERGADLYSPCKEAYDMLKNAMVGGLTHYTRQR